MMRFVLLAALVAICTAQAPDPNEMCFQASERRNQKDLYEDPEDCHNYYQCLYINSTFAVGKLRKCPPVQFFHAPVMTCMPEGEVPCVDRCLSEDATSARGCYAGTGCRQYFVCANTGSFGMCCPLGSAFVEDTCSCETSETCTDTCVQPAPPVPTTVAPAKQFNETVCTDSFGTLISIVPGETNAYWLLNAEGQATDKQFCPTGISFDLVTCRCDIENGATLPPSITKRQATLLLTFDTNTGDDSYSKFATFTYNGAERDTSTAAHGTGSLAVNGGYLSVPGLKSYDLQAKASWCGFFSGTGAGGILSNNKDATSTEFTAIFGTASSTSFTGRLNLWAPVGTQTVQATFTAPSNGWNHFCVTYDSNTITLYLNGAIADTQFVGGYLAISAFPFVVGTDQGLGTFAGNIDEVMLAPFVLSQDEVNLHLNGDYAALRDLGFFP